MFIVIYQRSFTAFYILTPVQYKSRLVSSFSDATLEKFASGAYRPIIAQSFPLSDLAGAHRLMESNANTGKIIIEVIPEGKKSEL